MDGSNSHRRSRRVRAIEVRLYSELDMSKEVIITQHEDGRGLSSEDINIEEESRIWSKSFGQSKTKPYSLSKHAMRQHSVDSSSTDVQPKMRAIPSSIKENETPPPVRKAFQETKIGKGENSGSLGRTSSAQLVKKKAIDDLRTTSLGARNKLARMSKKVLRHEFNFWNVNGIMNTLGLLQSEDPK